MCLILSLFLSPSLSYTDTPSPLSDSKSSHTPSPHTANGVHRQRSSSHCERSKENQHTNRSLHDDRDWVTMETGGSAPPSSHPLLHMISSCHKSKLLKLIYYSFLNFPLCLDRTREEEGKEAERLLHQTKEEEKEEKVVQVR